MTGMFQSSRIASGNPRLQISSAFSPSSASTIWKSSPSRMRRATLRMTLESSTTRHVLILASVSSMTEKGAVHGQPDTRALVVELSCQLGRQQFEDTIDVEHHHELAV